MPRLVKGVMVPDGAATKHGMRGRVLNAHSRRRQEPVTYSRLDGLLTGKNPKICIYRRLGGIGDVIMTTPVLKHIKRILPNCHLVYATDLSYSNGALADIIRGNPYVDELMDYKMATARDFDLFSDFTATGLSREKPGQLPPNRIDMFAEQLGIDVSSDPLPTYMIADDEKAWAKKVIKEKALPHKPKDITLIGIQIKSNDARRTWPLEYNKQLIQMLTKDPNVRIALFHWEKGKHLRIPQTFNCDYSFKYTAALVDECDVVVTPDSAVLHIAGALQKKIVTVFGPVPPESRINYYANATAVIAGLPCQHCLIGESNVLTKAGYKPLEEIKEGDVVKTAHGLYKTVTKLHKNKRNDRILHKLKYMGADTPIIGTAEHKVLISRKAETKKDIDICTASNPEWIEIKNVKKGDYICLPRNKKVITDTEALGYPGNETDRCWLFGLYLAEGHTQWYKSNYKREYSVRFTLGSHEEGLIKKLKNILESEFKVKVFVNDRKEDGSTQIWINSKEVTAIFRSMFGENTTAATKFIPDFIKNLKTSEIKAFLDGYFAGDGYTDCKSCKIYTTKSRKIAYGVQELYTRFGILANVYHRVRDTNYKKNTDICRVYVYDQKRRWTRWCANKDYIYTPVKENTISERQDKFVYDITVEDDPTFTIDNVAINDCWYSPTCGGKQTCLKEVTPPMVHNAIMTKLREETKVQKVISHHGYKGFKPDNIVLVKRHFGGFGDIIQSMTAVEALAIKYPTKEIHYALPKKFWPAAENSPVVKKLLDADKEIRNNRYSIVMDISTPCAHYESSRVRQRKKVEKSRVEIFVEAVGVKGLTKTLTSAYNLTEDEIEWARNFLPKTDKPRLGVAMRCAEEYRNWPQEKYDKLIPLLTKKFQVVIIDPVREFNYTDVVDACGFNFRKAAAIVNECDIILTPDTAILHLAAALEKNIVTLFGPIDPQARCKGYKNARILTARMDCMPCWRNSEIACKKTGSHKGHSKCMEKIAIKDVYKALIDMRNEHEKA